MYNTFKKQNAIIELIQNLFLRKEYHQKYLKYLG